MLFNSEIEEIMPIIAPVLFRNIRFASYKFEFFLYFFMKRLLNPSEAERGKFAPPIPKLICLYMFFYLKERVARSIEKNRL